MKVNVLREHGGAELNIKERDFIIFIYYFVGKWNECKELQCWSISTWGQGFALLEEVSGVFGATEEVSLMIFNFLRFYEIEFTSITIN